LTGGKVVNKDKGVANKVSALKESETGGDVEDECEIGFASGAYSVLEGCGHLQIPIERTGSLKGAVIVSYKTIADNAIPDKNFRHTEGQVEFTAEGDKEKIIKVEILDNDDIDADNYFWVQLELVRQEGVKAKLGEIPSTHIRIVDDDDPGKIVF
jgi:hypothetical protein